MSNNAEYAGIPALAMTMLTNPPHDDKTAVTGDGIDFTVDTKTKIITNVSGKREFAVGDHDSERLTFQMDRYIEGHDMLLCNIARVHSFNGDTPNIYDIDDMVVDASNTDKVVFTWLLSSAAIIAAGPIRFALRFKCTDDTGKETYSWGTKINEDMSAFNTLENSETVVRENVDILEQWQNDLFGAGESAISDIHSAAESEKQQIKQKGAEIIESIPDDYNALVADVSELKGDLSQLSKEMIDVKGATVGQIIKVSAVDDTGKPTAWEPATPPSKLTDFKNDLYFSKEELFLTLTKNDFEYDEYEGWALYVSNPNTTFTEDGNGFAYKVNVSIGGKTYTNSGTYSDFKIKDSDPPSINEFFSTDDQSDFIKTDIEMSGGYNAKTDDENYSGFSIIINDYDVTWLDVDDFTLELYRIKYKKISIDTIDFGDFFDRLTYSELEDVEERIVEERYGDHMLFPLIYVSGRGFYAAMERYSTKSLDKSKQMRQYSIDPNVIGYKFSLDVGQTYTSPTTNNMRIYEAGNSSEMSANNIFAMSKSSGSGNIIFDATINGTKVRSVPCQSLYNAYGSTDFKAYSMLADGDKLYSICAERVGTSGTISVKRLM